MHVLVAYDIPEDRRRTRLARRLCGLLERVQYSVFEGKLDDRGLEALRKVIGNSIDPNEDQVAVWRLCARCCPAIERFGVATAPREPDEDILL